jgi:hypothetical protein
MALTITPSLGAPISVNDGMVGTLGYWDSGSGKVSPQLGSMVKGSDGHDYVYAQASAAVASNAVVILTEPAMTFATGAGAWTAPLVTGGTPILGYAWLQRTAI